MKRPPYKPDTPGPKPKSGEYILCTHKKSWEDKELCKNFARSVSRKVGGNKIRLFKTKKGWGFHVLYSTKH